MLKSFALTLSHHGFYSVYMIISCLFYAAVKCVCFVFPIDVCNRRQRLRVNSCTSRCPQGIQGIQYIGLTLIYILKFVC